MNNFNKSQLRAYYAQVRAELKDPRSEALIAEAFFSSFVARKNSFFVYRAFRTEVATQGIIQRLLAGGKKVCIPLVNGKELCSVPFHGEEGLVRGAYGIEEPIARGDEPCEVALTPLLAVDKLGYRLGYGGGFYDRYFARNPNVLRVGLCFDGQKCELLPAEETDIPLDAVITQSGISFFSLRR